jgi:N-acetylglucosamine kinase-like BadF-type ATPase
MSAIQNPKSKIQNSTLVLGIDGGGSKTRAVIGDASGVVLGVGVAGSSNYQSVGFAAASTALLLAVDAAFAAAGIARAAPIVAACCGLAGIDRPEDRVLWERWAEEQRLAERVTWVNDAELVLAGGTPDGWGLALICGTGSICYGRALDRRTARAGGWGYLLGDEGSGYDLGLQALHWATQTADGRADAHMLLRSILETWQLSEPEQLIGHVYRPETTRAEIARLSQTVLRLADAGDLHARQLLNNAAAELGRMVAAVARRLDFDNPPLALGGGLIGASARLQDAVQRACGIPLQSVQHVGEPVQGALVIARRMIA